MKIKDLMVYHIFPLGAFCDAAEHGIKEVSECIPHIKKLGLNTIYFSPVFDSSSHGYDTKDYFKLDSRLGSNDDFAQVCKTLHENEIHVILDGVFNHVGREFWAFEDVLKNHWNSPYKDWFYTNFDGNSNYDDGFWYEGWEGHYELVKLNLDHPDVRKHLLDAVEMWMDQFQIDGLRLDVAYMLNRTFMKELVDFTRDKKPDFIFIGEMLHGDYNTLVNDQMLDSVTNYECYKGMYSSFNSHNMHEIGYSLNRQFGPDQWSLYKGMPLYNFVDNHDVTRIASQLIEEKQLPLIYALLFAMPGIPSVYYGSEWGMEGRKGEHDDVELRPRITKWVENDLTQVIGKLAEARKKYEALRYGDYLQEVIDPNVLIFSRRTDRDKIIFAVNIGDDTFTAHFDAQAGCGTDVLTGQAVDFGGGLEIPGYTAMLITEMQ